MKNYIKVLSLLLLAASSITVTNCKGKKVDTTEKILGIESYYEIVLENNNSNHEIKEAVVIQSQEKMQNLFSEINMTRRPGIPLPNVDFNKESLIFAYGGRLSTGGNKMNITQVKNEDDQLHFEFQIIKPQGTATMSITTPVMIVRIKNDDRKITASI